MKIRRKNYRRLLLWKKLLKIIIHLELGAGRKIGETLLLFMVIQMLSEKRKRISCSSLTVALLQSMSYQIAAILQELFIQHFDMLLIVNSFHRLYSNLRLLQLLVQSEQKLAETRKRDAGVVERCKQSHAIF